MLNNTENILRRIARQDLKEVKNENSDVVFTLPDLVAEYSLNNVEKKQLEAFRTKSNDAILTNKSTDKYDQLHWVSLGYPELTAIKSSQGTNLFRFTRTGFYTYVEMLTEHQKNLFVNEAKRKYNINVKKEQITTLIASEFKCKVRVLCKQKPMWLSGNVFDLKSFPLALKFDYANVTAEKKECIKKEILENMDDLELECQVFASASSVKENKFSIDFNSENNNQLVNELFGRNDSVYVTRNQMDDFSQEVYSSMNVFEQFEMPDEQFSNVFVEDLIRQLADDGFKSVPFEQAISGISRFNIDEDLQPDVINSELSKVFDVKQQGGKDHLVINREQYERLNDRTRNEYGGSVSIGFKSFSFGSSYNQVNEKQKEMEKSGKSIDDQLKEFNKQSDTTVEYRFDGKKVVPKSLKVAKFTKSKFKKSIQFSRIRKVLSSYQFERKYSLFVSKAEKVSSFTGLQESIQLLLQKIESKENVFKDQLIF